MGVILYLLKQSDTLTKNLHLEHPEDQILTGDVSVLKWLSAPSDVSVKMDGSVAVVWGTNPENGKFFVGKKSVFNKVKVQICYTIEDIQGFYSSKPELAEILTACLEHLPRTEGIYQGDWIGFGGESKYTPNTITYDFGTRTTCSIIICPHTVYSGSSIRGSVASPLTEILDSTDNVLFIQPTVDSTNRAVSLTEMYEMFDRCNFLTPKAAAEVKPIINQFIREGKQITIDMLTLIVGDYNLAALYHCIIAQKVILMSGMIVYDGPKAFIGDQPIDAEGFCRTNKYGTLKLVDRYSFAQANFNNGRFQTSI